MPAEPFGRFPVADAMRRSMQRLGGPSWTALAVHALRKGPFLP
jgi:hypothetical protein